MNATHPYAADLESAREDRTNCAWIGDSHHRGTTVIFDQVAERWYCVDLENHGKTTQVDGVALVRLEPDADADEGLNQNALACDLSGAGIWIVSTDWLDECEEGYVEVLWRSDA